MSTLRDIKVRKVDFKIRDGLPIRWFKNNLLISHFVDSLHLIFPDGEKFFIRSVKAHEDYIKDPELMRQVKAFIGQELIHGNEHKKFWDNLRNNGYDVDKFLDFYNNLSYEIIEKSMNNLFGPKFSLSVTVALEHYTATLAKFAFEEMKELEGVHDNMREMLLWHAAEEVEHRSVAFDVLKEVDPSYSLRVAGMVRATIALATMTLLGFFFFIFEDLKQGRFFSLGELLEFLEHFTKLIRHLGKEMLTYFKTDFHPDQTELDRFAIEFFKRYNVERGNKVLQAVG